ncbi:hypothetical protein SAMN05444320_105244 [Streptoalloteichus hindustanus]|uniref:Uncharacterized protein n=1 Tax=Streptoalloteichus hindustanus TaxID=2017 RepID=A0A1M5F265_STRHI|nr:hypothetical protein SAMN05444320_105244 [Streptoalloteichus hindustanus]
MRRPDRSAVLPAATAVSAAVVDAPDPSALDPDRDEASENASAISTSSVVSGPRPVTPRGRTGPRRGASRLARRAHPRGPVRPQWRERPPDRGARQPQSRS